MTKAQASSALKSAEVAYASTDMVAVIGSQELRAGRTYIVKTQTFECNGTIRYVDIAEE